MPPSTQWCCPQFQDLYETAGERGFGLTVEVAEGLRGAGFLLQARAVDASNDAFHAHLGTTPFPVSTVTETGILHCPWCGVNLNEYYASQARALARSDLRIPWDRHG
jgi:hypothetical protein